MADCCRHKVRIKAKCRHDNLDLLNILDDMKHISGLDSLRFIAALIVFLGHLNIQLPHFEPITHALSILWANSANGPAAVIVFFCISGLVIHLPFSNNDRQVNCAEFYSRRLIRIAIPALTLLCIQIYLKMELPGVLWSIVCELIYYGLYPALLPLSRRYGWPLLIVSSALAAVLLVVSNVDALIEFHNGYPAFGLSLTWVVGLPVWLAGAWLAENLKAFKIPKFKNIVLLRLLVVSSSIVLRIVKFHVPAPWGTNAVWLNIFAILVVYWLGKEIAWRQEHSAPNRLEGLGKWSYSLYLFHPVVIFLASRIEGESFLVNGLTILMLGLVLSWIFYIFVERPSHILARIVGSSLRKRRLAV